MIYQFCPSDKEEFLYLLNLKKADIVRPHPWSAGGEQGFINEVYLWERLDLGLDNNLFLHYILESRYSIVIEHLNVTIYHFAGQKPEAICKVIFSSFFVFLLLQTFSLEMPKSIAFDIW